MAPRRTCECGTCQKCRRRAYMREWYAKNAERHRETAKASRRRRIEAVRAYDRFRYERDKEKRRALAKRWLESDTNRKKAYKAKKDWDGRNPEKYHAKSELNKAVQRGEIKRMPCEVCGKERAHAHHDDYSKPFEVRWLCPAHHSEHHKKLRWQS